MFCHVTLPRWTIAVVASKAAEALVVSIFPFCWVACHSCRVRLSKGNTHLLAGACADRAIPIGASKGAKGIKVVGALPFNTHLVFQVN
jgi:hypothetical protein